MKKYLVFLFLVYLPVILFSQPPFPSADEIRQFISSKTLVVLEDNTYSAYNVYIRQAVKEYWKITPYEFVTSGDFDNKRIDPSFSFLVLTETTFEKDKSNSAYNFLNLLQGKDVEKIGEMPEICAIPLSCTTEIDLDFGYKLGAILAFIQNHAGMISEDPTQKGRRYLKYYNKNVPEVTDKLIFVKKEDLSPTVDSEEKIRAIYKNRLEIVPKEEIAAAILDKLPGALVLHVVSPGRNMGAGYCFKMLIGTEDSDMYYYDQHMIDRYNPAGLLPSDLKRLSRF